MSEQTPQDIGWAIVELMGHRRLGGYVREVEVAGHGMLRVDVPGEPGESWEPVALGDGATIEVDATQFYSPSALYCLTPTTEEMARAVAAQSRPQPVQRWELPAAPTAELDDALEVDEDGHPF